jgi:DNA-binding transcriptional ArsR family regulator
MDPRCRAELCQLHASFCHALADANRLLIIEALRDGPCTISDLVAQLDVGQSTVSRHVAVLRERGIVTALRHGSTVLCSLADRRVLDALDLLRGVMRDHIRHESELIAPAGGGS